MNRHVSNDGVTILLSVRAIHPVARMIVRNSRKTGTIGRRRYYK